VAIIARCEETMPDLLDPVHHARTEEETVPEPAPRLPLRMRDAVEEDLGSLCELLPEAYAGLPTWPIHAYCADGHGHAKDWPPGWASVALAVAPSARLRLV
jgi:hypothetical protein